MKTLIVAIALASSLALAAEDYVIPWQDIRSACQAFLDSSSSKEEVAGIQKRLSEHAKTRVSDQGVDEATALRSIMLDWAASNGAKVEKKERKAMAQACVYFITFIDKGFDVPWQIRERLTEKNVSSLIDILKNGKHAEAKGEK